MEKLTTRHWLLSCLFALLIVGCSDAGALERSAQDVSVTVNQSPTVAMEPTVSTLLDPTVIPVEPTTLTNVAATPQTVSAPPTVTPDQQQLAPPVTPVAPTATPAIPTATPIPATPVLSTATPAPIVYAPLGDGQLRNGGFEQGDNAWRTDRGNRILSTTSRDFPDLVRSGNRAALQYARTSAQQGLTYVQTINGVTVGANYRFSVWGRAWSSSADSADRTQSIDPGIIAMRACVNAAGIIDVNDAGTRCVSVSTLDRWHQLTLVTTANDPQLVIFLDAVIDTRYPHPKQNIVHWDDATFAIEAATAEPEPTVVARTATPDRPTPIPFDRAAMVVAMQTLRQHLDALGGAIDSLGNSVEFESFCPIFITNYENVIRAPVFSGVDSEAAPSFADYLFATDHALATNRPIYEMCTNGSTNLSYFNRQTGRAGIDTAVRRLIPAIERLAS